MTANPCSRFACGMPPYTHSWEAFRQVSQSAAGPPRHCRSTLSSSQETEVHTLRIYWNKIYTSAHVSNGLLTPQQFHVCRCYLKQSDRVKSASDPFLLPYLRIFLLSFYLSKLSRANQFCSLALRIIEGFLELCSDASPN